MADQNKSNRKGMNTFADDIDRSPVLSELERIGMNTSRKGVQRTQLEDRIRGEGKLLNSLLEQGRSVPGFTDSPFYQEQTGALRESIRSIRSKMNSLDTTARTRAETEASNYIARQFSASSINSQATVLQKEAATQNRAFSMANISYDELNQRREDVMSEIRVRERNAQNEVKGMFTGRGQVDPERSAALGVMMSGTQNNIRDLASINAAQSLQRAQSADPNSQIKRLAEMGGVANQILSAESISQEIKSGGVNISTGGKLGTVANEDVNKEIVNQARQLAQALKELSEGAGKTDEELAKLRATADESASNLEKLQKAEAGGAGGGGRGTVMGYLGAAGGAFNAIGAAANQVLVGQRMQEVANIGGFANLANQQYDMYSKARGGDIASQLALSQFGEADKFGMEMKRGTNIAQSAYLAAGGLQTAAGGMQIAEGLKNAPTLGYLNSGVGNNLAQGAQNVAQGVATIGVTSADMARGTSAQAARLAGIQAQMQARQAINYVGAKQAQGLRDMYTGLDVVGQEMGSSASGFIERSTNISNLRRMQEARMSPEQYMKYSQQGAQMMGSTFNEDEVFRARSLERAGFGSAQTNIQRMGTLAAAGGNNPQASLQGVLEAAFSKSLDSSKALNMMVENTAAMAAGTSAAASGIDVTGAAATMLAAGTNPNMANREAALQQAVEAAQLTQNITTNRAATFSGMVNTAAIQQKTGISGVESIIAQGISIQEYKALQGNPTKAAEFYKNQGINVGADKAEEFTKNMLREKQMQLIRDKGMALNVQDAGGMLDRLNAGTNTAKDDFALNQAASLSGYKGGGSQLRREILGVTATNTAEGINKAANAAAGGSPDDLKSKTDDLRTSGFKQLSEAAASASTKLEKFGGALQVFIDLTKKYEQGGEGTENEFSDAASKMATDFSAATVRFDGSVTKFESAVQALSNKAGLRSNANPVMPQFVSDSLNQAKGTGPRGRK